MSNQNQQTKELMRDEVITSLTRDLNNATNLNRTYIVLINELRRDIYTMIDADERLRALIRYTEAQRDREKENVRHAITFFNVMHEFISTPFVQRSTMARELNNAINTFKNQLKKGEKK